MSWLLLAFSLMLDGPNGAILMSSKASAPKMAVAKTQQKPDMAVCEGTTNIPPR